MSKMIRVKLLLLLALVLAYGGIKDPAYAQGYCPTGPIYNCSDVPDFCDPAPGCPVIRYTYLGDCDGVPTYAVSCAECSSWVWGYCNLM